MYELFSTIDGINDIIKSYDNYSDHLSANYETYSKHLSDKATIVKQIKSNELPTSSPAPACHDVKHVVGIHILRCTHLVSDLLF